MEERGMKEGRIWVNGVPRRPLHFTWHLNEGHRQAGLETIKIQEQPQAGKDSDAVFAACRLRLPWLGIYSAGFPCSTSVIYFKGKPRKFPT